MPLCPQITNTAKTVAINTAITAVTYTSTTATYTSSGHALAVGDSVTITGLAPAGYNGTFTISSVAASTFTVANTTNAVVTDGVGSAASNSYTVSSVAPIVSATTSDTDSLSTRITTAQSSADGKNKINYSTSGPSGSGTNVGDIWWQYSGGVVIAQYSWTGASWASSPISSAVIANLDAAKITSGIISSIEYNNGSGTFHVTAGGALTATSATITGAITATSGSFTGAVYASSGSFTGSINSTSGVIGGWNISSGILYTGTLGSPNQYLNASGGALFTGTTTCSALGVNSNLTVGGTATITSTLNANASVTFGTSNTFEYLSGSGTLRSLYTYGKAVTTARAMQINSAGDFGTTASTRRKKHEIQPYIIDLNALLQLEVKSFKYLPEIDPAQTIQHGFIAEEAQALGLDELIQFDSDGIPDYFAYEKLSTFLLSLVQDLSKRVAELEKK